MTGLRAARFGLVGLVATTTYVIVTLAAIEVFRLPAVPSSVLGVAVSIGISYLGHAFYSFKVSGDHASFLRRFLLLSSVSLGLSTGIMWLMSDVANVGHRAAIAAIVLVIPLFKYICKRFWVFRSGLPAQ